MATTNNVDDLLNQAASAEHADLATAQQLVGEHAATQEQGNFQDQIDQRTQQSAQAAQVKSIQPDTSTAFGDVARDVGNRVVDIFRGAEAGPVHAFGELEATTAELLGAGGYADQIRYGLSHGEYDYASNTTGTQEQTGLGSAAQGITQFLTAFLPATGALKALGVVGGLATAGGVAAGGVSQALSFNPHDPRLSNLIESVPALRNPVTGYLQSQPGDSVADGMLKNALEGIVSGGAAEAVIGGFSAVLRGMRATTGAAEALKATDEAVPTAVESKPAPTPEVQPQSTTLAPHETTGTPEGTPAVRLLDANGEPIASTVNTGERAEGYVPPSIAQADTAAPQGAGEGSTTFDPQAHVDAEAQRLSMSIPADKQAELLQALRDGKYSDVAGVLEDTHRTIPWDTLSDGANLKELFNATEGTFGQLIKVAHGTGTVSSDTIAQLAKDIGGDVSNVSKLYADTGAQGGLAARITAGYNIMVASGRQLKDLADIARPLTADSAEGKQAILNFQKQLQLHAAIVGQVRQSSSEIGRALYAHRALKASSDVALSNIGELTGTVLGPKAIKQFLKTVSGGNLAKINAAADKMRGNGFMGVIKEIAQGGMLSGIPTQVANITGNATNLVIKQAERYLAGVIGNVRGVFMPTAEHATIRQAVAHTAGALAGVRDSFPLMVKALTTEQSISAAGRPLARAIYKDPTGLTGANLTLAQVINRVGQVVRYPGRLMGAIDNLNMGIGRQADLNASAYLKAAGEADVKGLTGDVRDAFFDSRMAELRADPTLQAHASEAGLYQSFQESARTRFGEPISNMLNSHPLVKLLVAPFVHRPLNMLRQSLSDYTPLGLLSQTQRATLKSGNADGDVALARLVLGTGGLLTSYELAANGYTTGARLGSRNTESLDGIPAHAIKLGGRYYSYQRVDPVGLWLSIGAELHEAVQRHYDPSDPDAVRDLATMARAGMQVVGQSAMEKSFLESVDQLTQSLGERDPVKADVLVQRLIASNVGKFVPFSGALRGAAQAMDTTRRSTAGDGWAGIWDSVKAGLPVLSRELTPQRDILGRPLQRPLGETSWFNPFGGATASTDPLNVELSKVAVNVKAPPRSLDGLSLEPKDFDNVIQRATTTPMFPGGTNLEGYLRTVTASKLWDELGGTADHGVTARSDMVQAAVDQAYDYAKQSFEANNKDFRAARAAAMLKKASDYMVPAQQPAQVAAQ